MQLVKAPYTNEGREGRGRVHIEQGERSLVRMALPGDSADRATRPYAVTGKVQLQQVRVVCVCARFPV